MQSAGQAVKIVVEGRKSGDLLTVLVELVHRSDSLVEDLADLGESALRAFVADLKYLPFGVVQNIFDRIRLLDRACRYRMARGDEVPQDRLLFDDAHVLLDRRPPRQSVSKRGDVGHAADAFDLFALRQLVRERDDVNGATDGRELLDAPIESPMRFQREIVGP